MFNTQFNFDFNFKPKTLAIIASVLSIIGIIFIIFAEKVGNLAIRVAMLVLFIIVFLNIKSSFSYTNKIKKMSDILLLIASVIVFIWPTMLVLILGCCLLYFSALPIIKMIKNKNFNDITKIILSVAGIIAAILCIFNSQGAINIVIRAVGVVLVALGCYCFYKLIDVTKNDNGQMSNDDRYKFINAEEVQVDESDKNNN